MAAAAAIATALALAVGADAIGTDPQALAPIVAVLVGTGLAALPLRLPRLAVAAFALGGLGAFAVERDLAADGRRRDPAPARSFAVEQYSTANLRAGAGPDDRLALERSRADVIAVRGLTPTWATDLSARLRERFPAQYLFPGEGSGGIGLFSREALGSVDSVVVGEVFQIRACHTLPGSIGDLGLYAVHLRPGREPDLPDATGSGGTVGASLARLSAELAEDPLPKIIVGDVGVVPWDREGLGAGVATGIGEADPGALRHQGLRTSVAAEPSAEQVLFTGTLRCVGFETLRSPTAAYLGNRASFQSTPTADVVAL